VSGSHSLSHSASVPAGPFGADSLVLLGGAEGIRTPDPLDAKGHFTSVPVASSSMVSPGFPYTAGVQSSVVTSCHLVTARVEGSVRGQMRVKRGWAIRHRTPTVVAHREQLTLDQTS
jgi:hypothetical protein